MLVDDLDERIALDERVDLVERFDRDALLAASGPPA